MQLSMKGSTKRVIQSAAAAATGHPMSNKAAKKWLKRQPRQAAARPTFTWPPVHSFPRPFFGLARYSRFPSLQPQAPFGWKQIRQPPYTETILLPHWIFGLIAGWEHCKSAGWRLAAFLLGLRRVKS